MTSVELCRLEAAKDGQKMLGVKEICGSYVIISVKLAGIWLDADDD